MLITGNKVDMDRYRRLFKNTILFTIGNIGSKLIIFMLVPLYTYTMTTSEYGTVDIIMTVSSLLLPFITLSVQDAILRFGMNSDVDDADVFQNAVIIVFIGSIILVLLSPIIQLYDTVSKLVPYLIAITILGAFRSVLSTYLKCINKIKIYTIDSILFAFLLALFNIYFLFFMKLSVQGYLLSILLSSGISILFIIIFGRFRLHSINKKVNFNLMKVMIIFSLPLILNTIAWWINSYFDRFMIDKMLTLNDVGLYAIATKMPSLLTTVFAIFIQAWAISSIMEFDKSDSPIFFGEIFGYLWLISILMSSGLIVIIKPVMFLYVDIDFFGSWIYVPFLIIGAVYLALANFIGSIYIVSNRSSRVMATTIFGAIINIVLNIILIPMIGLMGAVLPTMLSYIAIFVYRLLDSRKIFIFDIKIKKFVLSSILLITQATLMTFQLFNSYFMHILSLIIFICIFYINRADIFELMSFIRIKYFRKEDK